MLWGLDETFLFLCAVVAMLVVLEIGYRFGRHQHDPEDRGSAAHVSALQTALLGLMSLLLGFNFAMAASRFETRKTLIQQEVNAINTARLRARLLPPAYQQQVLPLLASYVSARIEFLGAGVDPSLVESASADASAIESQLFSIAGSLAARSEGSVTAGLFIESLNAMVDINEQRRAALDNHVPELVIHLLFAVAVSALGFLAYGYGVGGRRRHASTAILAVIIALILTTILDLDQPRSGLIRVREDSMLRLKSSLENGQFQ